jgi:hypothetical protein
MSTNGSIQQQPIRQSPNGRGRKASMMDHRQAPAFHRNPGYRSRWEIWSQAIFGRWVAGPAWHRPVAMLLASRLAPKAFTRNLIHLFALTIAPRISLRLVTQNGPVYRSIQNQSTWWPGLVGRPGDTSRPAEVAAISPATLGRTREFPGHPVQGGIETRSLIDRVPAFGQMTKHIRPPLQGGIETRSLIDRVLAFSQMTEFFRRPQQAGVKNEPLDIMRFRELPAAPASDRDSRQLVLDRIAYQQTALAPPRMILRRQSGPAAESSGTSQSVRQSSHDSSSSADPVPWPDRPSAPVVDVNRLTDQVIQTIDRRLTSWRERMGKV